MIINCLTLYNFGVYAGTNTFQFHGNKPIVLIGGLNGRGKTTFLEAVLLALYGSHSFAYKESGYTSYSKYLRSFINKNNGNQMTAIDLMFTVQEDQKNTYIIHRSWEDKKVIHEKIEVMKNGFSSEYHTKNWPMFIENLLPSALSNFFFFDGEKIAELAVDNTDEELKNSIRAMLGLNTLDVLDNDLDRVIHKYNNRINKNVETEKVDQLREAKEKAEKEYEDFEEQYQEKSEELQKTEQLLEAAKEEYRIHGGDIAEASQKLHEEIDELQQELEQNKEKMLAAVMSDLPMAMVSDLLQNIDLAAQRDHRHKVDKESFDNLKELYQSYDEGKNSRELSQFIEYVKSKMVEAEGTEENSFQLSDSARAHLHDLVNGGLEEERTQAQKLLANQEKVQREIDIRDEQLAADINKQQILDFRGTVQNLENKVADLKVELAELEGQRSEKHGKAMRAATEFNRAVNELLDRMETNDDAERMVRYAYLAKKILAEYNVRLQGNKVQELADTITECYKRLANKKSLIDHIEMDKETLEISYINVQGEQVEKAKLSAGEKQLMVFAILWALETCSKKKLPVIIDTPLSRLDSEHRATIVSTYFPNASEQTIILSTDTEIDSHYYQMIAPSIADEFYLDYHEDTKSTTVKRGYFNKRA